MCHAPFDTKDKNAQKDIHYATYSKTTCQRLQYKIKSLNTECNTKNISWTKFSIFQFSSSFHNSILMTVDTFSWIKRCSLNEQMRFCKMNKEADFRSLVFIFMFFYVSVRCYVGGCQCRFTVFPPARFMHCYIFCSCHVPVILKCLHFRQTYKWWWWWWTNELRRFAMQSSFGQINSSKSYQIW